MQTKIITYLNGQQALVLGELTDKYRRGFVTYRVLNSFGTGMYSLLPAKSRYITQIRTVEARGVIADYIYVYSNLKMQQERMKCYQARIVTVASDEYLHDGRSQPEYTDYFVEADDKYEVAFKMTKFRLKQLRRMTVQVREALNPVVIKLEEKVA